MLLFLAWRNIWRSRKRSLIILAAVGFGLWGGLFAGAIFNGMSESMVNSAIDRNIGHIQIHSPGFAEEYALSETIGSSDSLAALIRKIEGVAAVSGRGRLEAMIASATTNFGVQINAIDTVHEKQSSSISAMITSGRYFGTNKRNELVIGQKLADRLRVRLQSKVVISFQALNGDIQYEACRIVGLFQSASGAFDETNAFMRRQQMANILGQDLVHEMVIRATDANAVAAIMDNLAAMNLRLQIQSWQEIAPELAYISSVLEVFSLLFIFIIILALLFGIINTMLMSVLERTRELGMLMAVGMGRQRVFFLIVLETVMLSLTGTALGLFLGVTTIKSSAYLGLNFSFFSASLSNFGISTIVYPFLPVEMYTALIIMIVVAANFAAIMPASKAIRLQPAAAIRTY
jgi:putative ABC transport system permease protein